MIKVRLSNDKTEETDCQDSWGLRWKLTLYFNQKENHEESVDYQRYYLCFVTVLDVKEVFSSQTRI